MTNQEAIRLIRNLPTMCEFTDAYGEPIDSDAYYEAVDMAISALQAQDLQPTCNNLATDTISRQAAIDVLTLGKEILSLVLDNIDFFGTVREKYSWGLRLIESNIKDIEELPPAQPERCEDCENFSKTRLLIPQPEIIHCRECKHRDKDGECTQYDDGTVAVSCKVPDDHYCGYAERRTDELRSENSR